MPRRRLTAVAVVMGVVISTGTYVRERAPAAALGGSAQRWHVPVVDDPELEPLLEQNVGQFDEPVDFVVRGDDATVFVADGGFTYTVTDGDAGHAVRMVIEGAESQVEPSVQSVETTRTSYLIGADATRWVTDVPAAAVVEYRDVLAGVDIRYLGTDDGLRYDIVVAPGTDPEAVEFRFDGASGIAVDDTGQLVVDVAIGADMVVSAPLTYQDRADGRVVVESSYRVADDGSIGFDIGDYDTALPLVIDPTVSMTTYIGGASDDTVGKVLYDSGGAMYLVGATRSTGYPSTVGAYDTSYNGSDDIVVTKLNAAGTAVTWSTFIGGISSEFPNGAVLGLDGGVVIAAETQSSDFPTTTGAYDRTHNGGTDVAALRLAASGSSLAFSTFIGTSGGDYPVDVDVDTTDRIVVAGYTSSSSYPVTAGVVDTGFGGSFEGFVTKLATGGASLAFSTFLGNAGSDVVYAVDVDSTNDIHLAMSTDSSIGTTVGAYDTTYNGGTDTAYARMAPTATTLEYATYVGGTAQDVPVDVVALSNSVALVAGTTYSSSFPTTAGASDTTFGGTTEAYLARIDTSQTGSAQLVYSSFLGGTGNEIAYNVAVDAWSRAYLAGSTTSSGIATSGAPDSTYGGGTDAFAAVIATTGGGTRFATYFGGTGLDEAYAIAVAPSGAFALGGVTYSSGLATVGAYDTTFSGTSDGFVTTYTAMAAANVVQVNSTADGSDSSAGNGVCETSTAGQCTLRAAIQEANASATVDTIQFAIPTSDGGYSAGRGVFTITAATGLPTITAGVTISGATQTTNIGNTNPGTLGVSQAVGTGADGVVGTGDEPTIDGVPRPEVEIDFPVANGFHVTASNVTISGLAVFGGSADIAIQSGTGIVVEDMVIGTRADSFSDPGGAARSDGGGGVYIVGGTNVTVRNNLIGYQNRRGIDLLGDTTNVVISGNELRANGQNSTTEGGGIEIVPYWGGGVLTGLTVSGNLIANHANDFGIEVAMSGAETGLLFENNTFTGNSIAAVTVYGTPNAAGGTIRRNVVASNLGHGLGVSDAHNWSMLQNSISDNPWEGIYLATGANDALAAPTPTSAVAQSGTLTVGYTVTAPAGTYRVEFFDNTAADPIGNGEGETYRGAATVTHPGGTATYAATVPGTSGDIVSTTLTEDLGGGSFGSTSKFSATVTATLDPAIVVNATGDAADASPGDELCRTGGTNSAGAPACTLRAAIQEANAHAGITTIRFAMPATEAGHAAGVWTIIPTSVLPALSTALTLDATTQTGWVSTPVVELRGTTLPGGTGLSVTGDDVTVRGLAVRDVAGNGITVSGQRATVERNHLGTDAAGTTAAPNTVFGLGVTGSDSLIQWNLISGNLDNGLMLATGAHRARVLDNRIGTTVTGNAALPNGQEGVELTDADDVVIGSPGHGNVISGNGYAGINAWTTASTGVTVQANKIGVGADGTTALGNADLVSEGGITFRGPTTGWLIGGDDAGEGNVIANNTGDGVQLWNGQGIADDIAVIGNSIHSNTGLGIDLGDDGVTLNDAGDGDTGANGLLNMPVISAVTSAAGSATATYSLDVPAGTYRVEFFSNVAADPSGYGEGGTFRHAATVTHPGGSASYTASFALDGGEIVTATATEVVGVSFGATSEFSAVVGSLAPISVVNSTGDATDATPGNGRCDTGATIAGGARECTLRAAIAEANAHAGVNSIEFAIPATDPGHTVGVWRISPATPLPDVTAPATIDATTQPGWSAATSRFPANVDAHPVVHLDGSAMTGSGSGVAFTSGSGGSSLRGLSITGYDGWSEAAVLVSAVEDVVIVGNMIGRRPDGVTVANEIGVWVIDGAIRTQVGGPAPADRNALVGNQYAGVAIAGASATTVIRGNEVRDGSFGVVTWNGPTGTLIGGVARGAGNIIEGAWVGVLFDSNGTTSHGTVLGNRITGNGESGFDLLLDGPTPNDPGDPDSGPNDLLNTPVLVTATEVGADLLVAFDLDVPAGSYRVELFANPSGADPSGFGEGERFAGAATVVHAGGGTRRYVVTVAGAAGDALTATVTQDLGGGTYGYTSEFSNAVTATASPGTVPDRSVRRNDLTALGGAGVAPSTGVAGVGLDLRGGSERLAGAPTELTSGAISLSGWVRLDALGTASRLISKSDGAGDAVYELLVDGSTGEAVGRAVIGGSTVEVRGGTLTTGTWHQLAATWDGTTVRLYVDGVEADSAAAAGALASDLDAPLVIGNTGNAQRGIDARIDQVRVGHMARSAADVATEYANLTQPALFVTVGARQTSAPGAWSAGSGTHRSGTHALAAPEATPGSAAWATATGLDEPGLAFESWWYHTSPTTGLVAAGTNTGTTPTDQREAGLGAGGVDVATSAAGARTVDGSIGGSIAAGTWTRVEIRTDELGRSSVWIGGTQVIAPTAHSGGTSAGAAGLRADTLIGQQWYVDDVLLRRYVSDEPTTVVGPITRN